MKAKNLKKNKLPENTSTIVLLILLALILIFTTLHSVYFHPLASQNALEQCIDRNFDYAEKFNQLPFTIHALGVKCGKINKEAPLE